MLGQTPETEFSLQCQESLRQPVGPERGWRQDLALRPDPNLPPNQPDLVQGAWIVSKC